MGRIRFRGRDWVKSILLDSNADPGSTKHVDPGTCLGKITSTEIQSFSYADLLFNTYLLFSY